MTRAKQPFWDIRSNLPGAAWPALPDVAGTAVHALLYQLERSQWLDAAELRERQQLQLRLLLAHAHATVPFYRAAWGEGAAPDPARFADLPLLSRRDLQQQFERMKSTAVPAEHGAVTETRSSGSTGMPVRVLKTALTELFWRAFALRDHLWHRRDLAGRLAAVRLGAEPGDFAGWGAATGDLVVTGASATLGVTADIEAQLKWLHERQPHYLLTYPSNAAELARSSLSRGSRIASLREVRTIGEQLPADLRALCREAWDVPVTDVYSADEIGYLALQCPAGEHYHVQSEGALIEILDEEGRTCAPGQLGRIVITSLHNYATPLIRYDIGDYAEAGGGQCACGRGLPVLARIAGRVRNMLISPAGERFWPSLGLRHLPEVPKLRQYQFVQKARDLIEARLVAAEPLSTQEQEIIRQRIVSRIPAGMRVTLVQVAGIARGPGGKYEEFLSEIAPEAPRATVRP